MSIDTLRNEIIASNIANRDVQGYQRLKLDFGRTWDDVPVAAVVPDKEGASSAVEQDLVDLSTNAVHYESMARVLSRYFSIINTITSSRG